MDRVQGSKYRSTINEERKITTVTFPITAVKRWNVFHAGCRGEWGILTSRLISRSSRPYY